jgi:hypothetical protein
MVQAGFEFEFGHDVKLDLIKQILKLHYPNNKIYTLTEYSELDKILSKNYFIFKYDTSVGVNGCKYDDTEMVTPVFVGKKSILLNFKKIFNILKDLNIKTNNTCSIHINVSFTENSEMHKINLGKLYLYINELQLLRIFKRTNNVYSMPCMSYRRYRKMINESTNNSNLLKRIERFLLLSAEEHHQAIALDKQKDLELNIIEFRFIGGDYIGRFDDANKILNIVLDGMNFAIGKNNSTTLTKLTKSFKSLYKK